MSTKINVTEEEEFFGPLYPMVADDNVTDVDFNGSQVWITDASNNRLICRNLDLDSTFVEQLTSRVANGVSKPFNKQNPILEAETDCLRITIVHESVAPSGRCICIRKSLPYVRLSYDQMLAQNYCTKEVLDLLLSFVRDKKNIVVVGEPGSGKTELCKFLSGYIPIDERVITIEDTPEWHYSTIHPEHDAVELQVSSRMSYTDAIKTCLRLNPKWMMLSEARSKEVVYLIESLSTGVRGMTTLHASDVSTIPDRMLNMAGNERDGRRLENDIYTFVDVGILVRRGTVVTNRGQKEVRRYIDQICLFERTDGKNRITMLVDGGELLTKKPERRTYYEAKTAVV